MPAKRSGPIIIAVLVLVMLIAHQDNWFWDDDTLVLGFIPIGLFYHACLSVAASCVWFLATKIAWPVELVEEAKTPLDQASDKGDE